MVALVLVTYWAAPVLGMRLLARFGTKEDFDPDRPGASLRMAGALLLGWGLIALVLRWWWFAAVAIAGGALLVTWGRARSRR